MPVFQPSETAKKVEELARRLPLSDYWLPDAYDPSNYLMPVGGLTKMMGNRYLQRLVERIKTGRIPAFHGTTAEAAEKIAEEGFKGVKFQDVIKNTYESFGIPWEQRRQIPKTVRDFIESDARQRIMGKEGDVISFAPTRAVAERWAGKGGEVAHETWKRLSEWFTAKSKGMTGEQFLNAPWQQTRVPYRDLGVPAVIKAEIPLSSQQQKQMEWIVNAMQKSLEEGDKPKDVLRSFFELYHDIRVPQEKLSDVNILKILPKRSR